MDRWVSAGRQFVDGVSGTRPGSRAGQRPDERRPRPSLDGIGRWVEDRLDWLMEDGEDWREPWQEEPAPRDVTPRTVMSSQGAPQPPSRSREPLEAISRRGRRPSGRSAGEPAADGPGDGDWPDDETFTVPRWSRSTDTSAERSRSGSVSPEPSRTGPPTGDRDRRPLPRSSRRR